MDCKHARQLLTFVRPNHPAELDADEAQHLQRHLDGCPGCAGLVRDEQRVDDCLGRAMLDVALPPNLRLRILNRVNSERDVWYRTWLLRAAGVAAGLFLAVWVGYAFWPATDLDMGKIRHQVNDNPSRFSKPEDVETAFKEDFGVTMTAPPEINYQYLAAYHMALVQDRPVPYLLLRFSSHGGEAELAHVYVFNFNGKTFDLEKARTDVKNLNSGRYSVDVIPREGYFYVIVYSGGNRNLFLKKPPDFH